MSEAVCELIIRTFLFSSPKEKLTPEEANLFIIWGRKAVKELASGILIGFAPALLWTAHSTFKKLNINYLNSRAILDLKTRSILAAVLPRAGLASLVVGTYGLWRFNRSLDSWVDPILAMNGSLLQRNLAIIIVNRYKHDPWLMQRFSRHFYLENVYDDTTSDKPIVLMRYRNLENVDQGKHVVVSREDSNVKKAHMKGEKVPVDIDADVMEDPLDNIFGGSDQPFDSTQTAKARNHSHGRSHHRRRVMHRHETCSAVKSLNSTIHQ